MEAMLRGVQAMPIATVKVFSSIAASLGSGGQSNYAAANAVLDARAAQLQLHVRPHRCVYHKPYTAASEQRMAI